MGNYMGWVGKEFPSGEEGSNSAAGWLHFKARWLLAAAGRFWSTQRDRLVQQRWSEVHSSFISIPALNCVHVHVHVHWCAYIMLHTHITGYRDHCHLAKYFIIFYGLLSLGSADTSTQSSKCWIIDCRPLWKTTISASAACCACVGEVHCQQDAGWASLHISLTFKRTTDLPGAWIEMGWIKTRLGIVAHGAASFIEHRIGCMSICAQRNWV